jgi:hypothetical protein
MWKKPGSSWKSGQVKRNKPGNLKKNLAPAKILSEHFCGGTRVLRNGDCWMGSDEEEFLTTAC